MQFSKNRPKNNTFFSNIRSSRNRASRLHESAILHFECFKNLDFLEKWEMSFWAYGLHGSSFSDDSLRNPLIKNTFPSCQFLRDAWARSSIFKKTSQKSKFIGPPPDTQNGAKICTFCSMIFEIFFLLSNFHFSEKTGPKRGPKTG